MSKLIFLATFGICIALVTSDECDLKVFPPAKPFRFAQQICWDNRTNSIFFADTNVDSGVDSLFRFDWDSQKLYSAHLTKTDDQSPVSFIIPSESSPGILIAGQGQSVLRVQWNGVSPKAKLLNVIATRSEIDNGAIDRGTTSPDGTLFLSILPKTLCDACNCDGECGCDDCSCGEDYPASAYEYLDSDGSIKSALRPGSYTNGMSFDSKTGTCYIADDCSATVYATKWDRRSNVLDSANKIPVFELPFGNPLTNYPSGLELDQCSNFYVGDHNSGIVYYVNSKTGKIIEEFEVPGSHVTSVGVVGKNLDYLCVLTGIDYEDSHGGSVSTSTNPGDGKMYLIPINSKCCKNGCKGSPGVPVCGY